MHNSRLTLRFILLVVGAVLLTLLPVSLLNYQLQTRANDTQLREHGELLGRYLANITPEEISAYDFIRLNEMVRRLEHYQDLVYAVILDSRRQPLTSQLDIDHPLVRDSMLRTGSREISKNSAELSRMAEIMHLEFPIELAGEHYGTVQVGLSRERLQAQNRRQLLIYLAAALLATALLGLLVYLIFRNQVLAPLDALRAGAERVAKGEFEQPVAVLRADELGDFTHHFNQMASSLLEQHTRLHEGHHQARHQLEFQQQLIDAVPMPIYFRDRAGHLIGCNQAFAELVGKPSKALLNQPLETILPECWRASVAAHEQQVLSSGKPYVGEHQVNNDSDDSRTLLIHSRAFRNAAGDIGGLVAAHVDISARIHYEQRLREMNEGLERRVAERTAELARTNQYMQNIVDLLGTPTLVIDADNYRVRLANRAARALYGDEEQELPTGISCHRLTHQLATPCSGPDTPCPITELRNNRQQATLTHRHYAADGREFWVEVTATPILDEQGHLTQVLESHRDITRQVNLQAQLKAEARLDPLTGAANRRRFEEVLPEALIESEHSEGLALVMFDLDHFKQVNDRYGHAVGDQVLRRCCTLVAARIRHSDLLCRWGGEEFILLLRDTTLESAEQLAEALRGTLENTHFAGAGQVTASFGVTVAQSGEAIETLLDRLDGALYAAKRAGRNRVASASSTASPS